MGKSKRKAIDPKNKKNEDRLDDTFSHGSQTNDPAPQSRVEHLDDAQEQLPTDRQGSPINIRPKGMDA